jgi:hypothetical protein
VARNDDPSGCKNVWPCWIRLTEHHQRQAGTLWSAIISRVGAKMEGDRLGGPWLTLIEGEGDGDGCLIMSGKWWMMIGWTGWFH